ncbi:MAG TPA: hypothetical protein VFD70_29475 [Anaerolineae bacterium]|nr:hypothetical protein [Anaerolineae bacterium]
MESPTVNPAKDYNPLEQAKEGMKVYDRDGNEIGTVDRVYLGEVSPKQDEMGKGPATVEPRQPTNEVTDVLRRAFSNDDLPEVLRNRLLRNGFLHMDAKGILAPDRYVLPDQIASVSGDRITLRASRQELIKT